MESQKHGYADGHEDDDFQQVTDYIYSRIFCTYSVGSLDYFTAINSLRFEITCEFLAKCLIYINNFFGIA